MITNALTRAFTAVNFILVLKKKKGCKVFRSNGGLNE